ncbi:MAG: hypothetical protein Kow0080_02040 [Candidatus Promineifilaceae bacterium]
MSDMQTIQTIKQKYQQMLLKKANVVGVGIGYRQRGGSRIRDVVLVVMVTQKVPAHTLSPDDLIPRELDGVPVDVQAVGEIRANR